MAQQPNKTVFVIAIDCCCISAQMDENGGGRGGGGMLRKTYTQREKVCLCLCVRSKFFLFSFEMCVETFEIHRYNFFPLRCTCISKKVRFVVLQQRI